MTHVFTLDAPNAANNFYGAAPYTATNSAVALSAGIRKAGYYLELVRVGTNRRRFVWVDFDATGKTLDEIDFPWTGDKFHQVVTNLHVYSNDSSLHNISAAATGYQGVVEATSANYSATDGQLSDLPTDMMRGGNSYRYGWNDTLNESGSGYGCFQVHRLFAQSGDDVHWNDAEVLLAWNHWSGNDNDDIGIGTFANNGSGTDYTRTGTGGGGIAEQIGSAAYQVRHLEIWVEQESGGESAAWLRESAAATLSTGSWSEDVAYGADGRASICDNAFMPVNASTGNVVTVEVTTQIVKTEMTVSPDAEVQAAVRLSTNGCFQVWVKAGNGDPETGNCWVDVEAEGVTPVSGEEYTLRFTFDYAASAYSVEVSTGSTGWTRLVERGNPVHPVMENFPLAFATNCVSEVAFTGLTRFSSLDGECYEVSGFAADEAVILSNNVQVILTAAQAAWLNRCAGGKKVVGSAAAGFSADDFGKAYLLNLDITGIEDVEGSYSFQLTSIAVDPAAGKVTIGVTLLRTGAIAQAVNGVLKFYGAATVEAFSNPALEPLGGVTLSDDDFSEDDTAVAEIPLDGETKAFLYKAQIE